MSYAVGMTYDRDKVCGSGVNLLAGEVAYKVGFENAGVLGERNPRLQKQYESCYYLINFSKKMRASES